MSGGRRHPAWASPVALKGAGREILHKTDLRGGEALLPDEQARKLPVQQCASHSASHSKLRRTEDGAVRGRVARWGAPIRRSDRW